MKNDTIARGKNGRLGLTDNAKATIDESVAKYHTTFKTSENKVGS